MKKSNLIIGIGIISLGVIGFFIFKNKKKQDSEIETDEEVVFENADGKKSKSTTIKPTKIVKIKDYQNLLLNTNVEKLKKDLIGKNIYTFIPNVMVRDKPYIDDIGIFNSKRFKIKNKGSFIGQVADVMLEKNGTKYFLAISEKNYNKNLDGYLFPFFNPRNRPTKYKNWVRTTDVVVDTN
jgi:hypothetical protein